MSLGPGVQTRLPAEVEGIRAHAHSCAVFIDKSLALRDVKRSLRYYRNLLWFVISAAIIGEETEESIINIAPFDIAILKVTFNVN